MSTLSNSHTRVYQIIKTMSSIFNKIDKSNMRRVILDFPKQFSAGSDVAKDVKVIGDFNQLIFCGMGGSALPASILKMLSIFYEWPIAIKIHRTYGLPSRVSPRALIFTVSYSGNTEETISSYEEAKKKNLPIIGIAAGGKLAELCKKNKTSFVKLPAEKIQPRQAVGYQLSAIVKVLSNSNIITDLDKDISTISKTLQSGTLEKQGKELAKRIKGKILVIYASDKYRTLAQIWKINFNENSKSPAFWNYFPELNHNEITGMAHELECEYSDKPIFHVLILKDEDDHPRIQKRMDITAKLLKEKGLKVETINFPKIKNLLVKIFSNYILSQWTSYYLALEYETDPSPVRIQEEFKKKLK